MGANLLPSMVYCSRYIEEECLVKYYDNILVFNRPAKWMVNLQLRMAAVDVHKRKLILKMGYFMNDILYAYNT